VPALWISRPFCARADASALFITLLQEECARIFEAYVCSPSNRGGGTGLGLYICQRFCEAMHGSIGVESEPGKGARFTIRVPAVEVLEAPAQEAPCSPRQLLPSSPPLSPPLSPGGSARAPAAPRDIIPQRDGRRLRALLVDDHSLNRKLCSKLLELQGGVDVSTADDGDVAVRLMTDSYGSGSQPFDFVLMDLAMPRCVCACVGPCVSCPHERCAVVGPCVGRAHERCAVHACRMNGLQATRLFRAWEAEHSPGHHLVIFALSANVFEEKDKECADAGLDGALQARCGGAQR